MPGPAARVHGQKLDHLLPGHMSPDLARGPGQGIGKTIGGFRIIGVNLFDMAGQWHRRGEVSPLHLVVVGRDPVDQRAGFLWCRIGYVVVHGTSILR
ncbi:hypothetical protein [Rhodosalinus sp. K401]|uniref:hypothetical protein n=1 Tax=Rhodosalinus sp. K401 TaxID=3239195 RepID=UPI003525678E